VHPLALPCLAMTAINAYLGVYHLVLALRRPQAREHLPFALLCLVVASYDMFCVGLYDAGSVEQGVVWQRLQLHSVGLIALLTIWFVGRLTGNERSRGIRWFMAWFAALVPVSLIPGTGLTVSAATPAVKHIAIAGRPVITYFESDVGIAFLLVIASAFVAYAYIVRLLFRHYRNHPSSAILSLLIGNLAYFAGVTNDSLVAAGVYPFVYVSEYAFFVLTSSMAYVLLTRFIELQSSVEALNVNLEITVAERTAALQRSLEQQRAMQARLVAASRRSGMADVATGVLHGIGNALNSVSVSVDALEGAVRQSRIAGLTKVARLLGEHRGDLVGFAATAQARLLPEYLTAATARLEDERSSLAGELAVLRRHVEHIKQAVDTQQLYAHAPVVSEATSLAAVVDEAIAANLVHHADRGIAIERDYAAVPEAELDRHKLLQVVSGLIDHAWHAVAGAPGASQRIAIRVRPLDDDRAAIEVEDTGRGIARDDLTRIFSHELAARTAHHGLDLHETACAAAELRATLRAASDGPGRGACLTLTLPLRLQPERAARSTQPADPASPALAVPS